MANFIRFLEAMQGIGTGAVFNRRELSAMFRTIRHLAAPIVFDAGAHKGQFLSEALARTQAGCVVHAFEPAAFTFKELSEKFGKWGNVHLNRCALSSMTGSAPLFYDLPGSQLASLTGRLIFDAAQSEIVQLDTLDDYCRRNHVQQIDLLKLDVEGHELEVLKGAGEMLERSAIARILFEFGGCHIDARVFFRDLYQLLRAHGLRVTRLTPAGALQPIPEYDESLERFRTTNYLAIR